MLNGKPVTVESVQAEIAQVQAEWQEQRQLLLDSQAAERKRRLGALTKPYQERLRGLNLLLAVLEREPHDG